ncbi:hypothetical protein [Flaviaesturariibacter amylovorans]|uniref:Uncharacterized protein n=1 Tax=Flaviaesturariibacter amylovorans TaxID=1084520 RepID=A0ABP8HE57_9BACT
MNRTRFFTIALSLFALGAASEAGAQQLRLEDLMQLTDKRKDTAFVSTFLRSKGFDRRGVIDREHAVFMGDADKKAKRFTEMVIVNILSGEIRGFQYSTRHLDNYTQFRRDLAQSTFFTGVPTKAEPGEIAESFEAREYKIFVESIRNQTRYVIHIVPRAPTRKGAAQ